MDLFLFCLLGLIILITAPLWLAGGRRRADRGADRVGISADHGGAAVTPGQTARLNSYVALCVDCSRACPLSVLAKREATIAASSAYAATIGIPPDEIAGAVEAAIKLAEAAAS